MLSGFTNHSIQFSQQLSQIGSCQGILHTSTPPQVTEEETGSASCQGSILAELGLYTGWRAARLGSFKANNKNHSFSLSALNYFHPHHHNGVSQNLAMWAGQALHGKKIPQRIDPAHDSTSLPRKDCEEGQRGKRGSHAFQLPWGHSVCLEVMIGTVSLG